MTALYYIKKIVGWLAVLSWLGWVAMIVLLVALVAPAHLTSSDFPFGEQELPWPDRVATVKGIEGTHKLSGSEVQAILLSYSANTVATKQARGSMSDHRRKYTNVAAAMVLDPSGKVVAASPESLVGMENPFPYPLNMMPTERGYERGVPYPSTMEFPEGFASAQKSGKSGSQSSQRSSGNKGIVIKGSGKDKVVVIGRGAATGDEGIIVESDDASSTPPDAEKKVQNWYDEMLRLVKRQVAGDAWVIFDPISGPDGKEPMGALVTVTTGYLAVTPQPEIALDLGARNGAAAGMSAGFGFIAAMFLSGLWAGLDARWRGANGWLWGILTFTMPMLGLSIYLIARPQDPLYCPRCRKRIGKKHTGCPYCGLEIRTRCPRCSAYVLHDWRYCPSCNLDVWEAPSGQPQYFAQPPPPQPSATPFHGELTRPMTAVAVGEAMRIQVLDSETGEAVRNAKITCKGPTEYATMLTDTEGRASCDGAQPGIYRILVQTAGYKDGQILKELKPGEALDLTAQIDPLPGKVSGNVYDAATKLPLFTARVRSDSSRVRVDVASDGLGRYEAVDVPAGPCILTCSFEGYQPDRQPCVIPPGGEALIDFALHARAGEGIPVASDESPSESASQ